MNPSRPAFPFGVRTVPANHDGNRGSRNPFPPQDRWPQFRRTIARRQGTPREWIYCWYYDLYKGRPPQAREGELARTHRYKLYRDGRFIDLLGDSEEMNPLDSSRLTAEQRDIHAQLESVIQHYTRPDGMSVTRRVRRKPNNNDKKTRPSVSRYAQIRPAPNPLRCSPPHHSG